LQALSELKRALDEKRASLHTFYKGLALFSLPIFSRHRAATLRRLLGGLVSANFYTPTFLLRKSCADFFLRLNMNPNLATGDSSLLFEQLNLKALSPIDLTLSEDTNNAANNAESNCSGSIFLSQAPMAQLFDRALIISRGGSLPSLSASLTLSGPSDTPPPTPPSHPNLSSASGDTDGHSHSGPVRGNPLAHRRASAVLGSRSGSFHRGNNANNANNSSSGNAAMTGSPQLVEEVGPGEEGVMRLDSSEWSPSARPIVRSVRSNGNLQGSNNAVDNAVVAKGVKDDGDEEDYGEEDAAVVTSEAALSLIDLLTSPAVSGQGGSSRRDIWDD